MSARTQPKMWAVVLAAGAGQRLLPLTRRLYGSDRPKQFAELAGGRSLLQETVHRIAPLCDRDRTLVVVAREWQDLAREQLAPFPGVEITVQPRNVGTSAGILLPLSHIRARDPEATVAFFPSDHAVGRPARLLAAVETAARNATSARLVLIGIAGSTPETEYGWIVPGAPLAGSVNGEIRSVRRFVEKPIRVDAMRLLGHGGLWNSFTFVTQADSLWERMRRHLPFEVGLFDRFVRSLGDPRTSTVLERIYQRLPPSDFSRDVLEMADDLGVVQASSCDWSDLGSPERVFALLHGTRDYEDLVTRMSHVPTPTVTLRPTGSI